MCIYIHTHTHTRPLHAGPTRGSVGVKNICIYVYIHTHTHTHTPDPCMLDQLGAVLQSDKAFTPIKGARRFEMWESNCAGFSLSFFLFSFFFFFFFFIFLCRTIAQDFFLFIFSFFFLFSFFVLSGRDQLRRSVGLTATGQLRALSLSLSLARARALSLSRSLSLSLSLSLCA